MVVSSISKEEYLNLFEDYLKNLLKNSSGELGDAMRYATEGGKRVRPLCVYYGAKSVGGNVSSKETLPLAAAVELIHSYSLVHDDMPEMDGDELRRGKETVHKKFGVTTALLTGDALLTLAMSQLLKAEERVSSEIAKSAMDMVYGQADEFAECNSAEEYLAMYAKKTGALIRGAFRAGALCASAGDDLQKIIAKFAECIGGDGTQDVSMDQTEAGASKKMINNVTKFAEHLGLAFQLADDLIDDGKSIIDVVGREETQKLLDLHSDKASECAKQLEYSEELIAFATELKERKA